MFLWATLNTTDASVSEIIQIYYMMLFHKNTFSPCRFILRRLMGLCCFIKVFLQATNQGMLARIMHEPPAATADMAGLSGVLKSRTLRRTEQVRLRSEPL